MTGTRDAALPIVRRAGNEGQIASSGESRDAGKQAPGPLRDRSADSVNDRENLRDGADLCPNGPPVWAERHRRARAA
jgi:hypothetical protein